MMGNRSQWWVAWAFGLIAFPGAGQCLKIRGTIADLRSHAPVPKARITIKTKDKTDFVDVMNGTYQIGLPCTGATIMIEAKGYSSFTMPVSSRTKVSDNVSFYVPFSLLPIDHQASDQPYFQSEQSHTELTKNRDPKSEKAERIFRITDAITDQPVQSTVCLYYTQTAQKDCFITTLQNPEQSIVFSDPDIVAIEVTAAGYQMYRGNLILDKLDNQKRTYTIRLQREATLLSITSAQNDLVYSLILDKKPVHLSGKAGREFYQFLEPGSYILKIADTGGALIREEPIIIYPGLNVYEGKNGKVGVASIPAQAEPKSRGMTAAVLPPVRTLYFDQSDYRLRPASRNRLDSLAAWLLQHPGQRVQLKGHTDNVGNVQRNQTLSEFRAKVVCTYLINKGMAESDISWIGVGSQYPEAPNETEANRQLNRRVEVYLTNTSNINN